MNSTNYPQFEEIATYVRFAQALPLTLPEVKVYVGYDDCDEPLLNPPAILDLFSELNNHASLWNIIVEQASESLRELATRAGDVVAQCRGVLRTISTAMGSSVKLKDLLQSLDPYLSALMRTGNDSLASTKAITQTLAAFREQASILEARLGNVVAAVRAPHVGVIGGEVTIGPAIDALSEARARIVRELGDDSHAATAIRECISKTLQELRRQEPELTDLQRLTYPVGRLFVHLQGLGFSILGAEAELTRPWIAGTTADEQLERTSRTLAAVGSRQSLISVQIDFQQVVDAWTWIRDQASALTGVL